MGHGGVRASADHSGIAVIPVSRDNGIPGQPRDLERRRQGLRRQPPRRRHVIEGRHPHDRLGTGVHVDPALDDGASAVTPDREMVVQPDGDLADLGAHLGATEGQGGTHVAA